MPRKGENIHKRKDGRWEARVIIADKYGIMHRVSLYGKTYKEVKEKKLSAKTEYDNKNAKKSGVSFAKVIDEWFMNSFLNQKNSTKLKYQNIIERHIVPCLGKYKISEVNENIINSFLTKKLSSGRISDGSGLSHSYVKTMAIIINSVMQYAVAKEYCSPLKTKIVKPLSEPKHIEIMDLETQKLLEDRLECDQSLTALGIQIALYTGLRIGEICALKWEDIDIDHLLIHVRHTIARIINTDVNSDGKTCLVIDKPKTKSSIRDIPITYKLLTVLNKITDRGSDHFVVSGSKDFISPRTFEYRYHKTLEHYSIPQLNFHGLRHTFATRCVELNVDIKSLSEILGHANVGITLNTYVHSSLDLKRNQLEKLSGIYS